MSRTAAFWTRAVVLLVGLVVGAVGAFLLVWYLDVSSLQSRFPAPDTTGWPTSSWWPWALGGGAAVLAAFAAALLIGLFARRSIGTRTLSGSSPDGALCADLEAVASAGAQCFAALDGVRSARYKLRLRRDTPTVEIIIHAVADVSLQELSEASRINAIAMHAGFGDTVAQRVYLRVDPVSG